MALVLMSACFTRTEPRKDPETESRLVTGRLTIVVAGAMNLQLDEPNAPIRIASISGKGYEAVHFLSVGTDTAQPINGDGRLRAAFDLIGWKGAGSYTIGPPASQQSTPATASSVLSSGAFVEYYEIAQDRRYQKFERVLQTCALDVLAKAAGGTLSCPSLEGIGGGTVSLEMRWTIEET